MNTTDEQQIARTILKKLYQLADKGETEPLMAFVHEREEKLEVSIPTHFSLVHLSWVRACEQGHLDCAIVLGEYLIKSSRFQADYQCNTAFIQALKAEHLHICEYLVEQGIDWMHNEHVALKEVLLHKKSQSLHYLLGLCWAHDHDDTIQNHDMYLMNDYDNLIAYYQAMIEKSVPDWDEGKQVFQHFMLYHKLDNVNHDNSHSNTTSSTIKL